MRTPDRELYHDPGNLPPLPAPNSVLVPDSRIVRLVRITRPGPFGDMEEARVYLVNEHAQVEFPRRYVLHSPSGYEWGYGGSGPADLALNILALVMPVKDATRGGLYQRFKWEVIAKVPRDGADIHLPTVRRWVADKLDHLRAQELATGVPTE